MTSDRHSAAYTLILTMLWLVAIPISFARCTSGATPVDGCGTSRHDIDQLIIQLSAIDLNSERNNWVRDYSSSKDNILQNGELVHIPQSNDIGRDLPRFYLLTRNKSQLFNIMCTEGYSGNMTIYGPFSITFFDSLKPHDSKSGADSQ